MPNLDPAEMAKRLRAWCKNTGVYGKCDEMHACDNCEHNKKRCSFYATGPIAAALLAVLDECEKELKHGMFDAGTGMVTYTSNAALSEDILRAAYAAAVAAGLEG